ncbi:MAG TPA: NADP-specific glutamate dehydrogenase, partial [Erysipelotrichaceae bacterium]|nr:NADP-specific glutamate dehydrogenase [Erysipelotrichaceae bacterium]
RDGYVYDKDGINTEEKWNFMLDIRTKNEVKLKDYAEKFGAEFHPG